MSSQASSESSAQSPHDAVRVGIVGLGTIGRGIATSLARRGRIPVVYDVRPEAADGLLGSPRLVNSAAEVAAASDVVFIAVVDAAQVTDVVVGPNGLLSGAHPGVVFMVTATIAVGVIEGLAKRCEPDGAVVLDCGVTGGSRAAENGLIALVGGPTEVVTRIRPALEDFTARVVHCGPLGAGMATKLSSQIVTAARWRGVHEAVELATACGVDPTMLVDVIDASDPEGTALTGFMRLRIAGKTVDAFSRPVRHYFRNVDKDTEAAQQLAAEKGVALPLVDLTRAQAADTFSWLDRTEG
jgi:3-hydroxyisobutyrate dehydrogenase-like beta-hydroxyacid dehydrogenase